MKIKAIKQLPRKVTIPGELSAKNYRALQKGGTVETEEVSATALVASGYAVEVKAEPESKKPKKKKVGDD